MVKAIVFLTAIELKEKSGNVINNSGSNNFKIPIVTKAYRLVNLTLFL